ncbi:TetR/AcrR family transcriptional regulator C-terminal domain-containing protein [Arthrobacter sp. efr-133-TYG-120]|uniref:TetR/AcrR family transcriptional regulator C-terminal domain-containing protein n=1 Tax=Arthrobacter sp. efr-133-TYG-120 TaxID=3040280 RepID=UPI00254AD51F|nr:TetR/AcrR family transcriptional regulator C-terminal domain-containing protein [Arthrobacter sp. efr-133-TYG-120]
MHASRTCGTRTPPASEGLSRRRAGRPFAAILDKTRITSAALEIIGRKGYDGLTMAGLAKQLEVAPSALYNHVTAKRDVLQLAEDHLISMVDVSLFGRAPWEEAARIWAWSYRDVFAQHTSLIPVIAVLPVTNAPQTLEMYETVTRAFAAAGFPQNLIVSSIVAFESFIFGSAYDVTAPDDIFEAGSTVDSTPHFRAALKAGRVNERPADTAFELGLEALIAALARSLC